MTCFEVEHTVITVVRADDPRTAERVARQALRATKDQPGVDDIWVASGFDVYEVETPCVGTR